MTNHSVLYETIQKQFIEKWTNCPDHYPESKRRFSYFEKRIWEARFDRFLQYIKTESNLEKPNTPEILKQARIFFEESLSYSNDQLDLIFSNDMLMATKDFIRQVWNFDHQLGHIEIFQALRNVWIMLGLQSFFGKEVKVTPSLLAYSLLYPYTDNLIDDASISKEEKLDFSDRFALRLEGNRVEPTSDLEAQIFELVAMIESEYEREHFPDVYASLLAIHSAQTKSLDLVSSKPVLSEEETFQVCIEKGATSVIADGYLVLGNLDETQFHFLYEYGAYLQILDDLQDAKDDYREGIMTCFSRKLPFGILDKLLCKTYYLGKSFHQNIEGWYPNETSFQGLIKRSFGLLFLASIFQNQDNFSKDFIRTTEKHAPFRFSFLHKKKNELDPFRELLFKKIEAYREQAFSL